MQIVIWSIGEDQKSFERIPHLFDFHLKAYYVCKVVTWKLFTRLYFDRMLIRCNIFVELEHLILFNTFDKYHNFIYFRINIKLIVQRQFMSRCSHAASTPIIIKLTCVFFTSASDTKFLDDPDELEVYGKEVQKSGTHLASYSFEVCISSTKFLTMMCSIERFHWRHAVDQHGRRIAQTDLDIQGSHADHALEPRMEKFMEKP